MDYFANVDGVCFFAEAVLPLIRRAVPNTEFIIVGSNPARRVRQLAQRPGVSVTGYVVDPAPYLAAATVCVAPLRVARGVQNKLLEAMAMGKAVVATPFAAAGLGLQDGEQVLVGRSAQDLAGAVLQLLHDETLRVMLGARARGFVERRHRWQPLLDRLAQEVELVASAPSLTPLA